MKTRDKRILLTTSLFLILLFLIGTAKVKAAADNNPIFAPIQYVQDAINTALSPVQSSIQGLSTRVSNVEATVTPIPGQITGLQNHQTQTDAGIVELSSRLSGLDNRVSILENISNDPDFRVSFTNTSFHDGSSRWTPEVHLDPTWKGVALSSVEEHGIWQAASGDIPFVNTGNDLIYPNAPFTTSTPVTIPVDVSVFWQGVTKHFTSWVTVPH